MHCNQVYTKGVTLSTSTINNTPHFADDQNISVDSEDNVQGGVFILQNKNFGMEKSETMSFLGQDPVRCKIVADNKFLHQL